MFDQVGIDIHLILSKLCLLVKGYSGVMKTFRQMVLVTQHCDPPYRAIGQSYTYRIYVFLGIAGYRAIPPSSRGIAKLC